MSLLKEPINRGVYDFIIKSPHVESLFDRYVLYIVTSLREQTLSRLLFHLLFSVFFISTVSLRVIPIFWYFQLLVVFF